jgi:hypothetical protein
LLTSAAYLTSIGSPIVAFFALETQSMTASRHRGLAAIVG